jgi:DNA helicase II / ATP-dependent DNA helicase PcrA
MQNTILKELNAEQQKAVLHTDGPAIILAGAGSGKTRVLTYKVLYLVTAKQVNPDSILMVTFTNKAAQEMKERLTKYFAEHDIHTSTQPFVSTFHSLCARILRIEGKHIGLSPRFVIYDTLDQLEAIKDVMGTLYISTKDFKPGSILATISQAKNELISEKEYPNFARGLFQQTVAKVYPAYQNLLKENDALDFDDLLLKTVKLFQENEPVLDKYQELFRYIMIDEYQDTNKVQYALTKLLAKKYTNVCVVGDFSQSIYSWRGADFTNLSRFKQDFENVKEFSLSQNYRSTQKILDAASAVISRNTSHPVLKLWTENPDGDELQLYEAKNEQDEAEFIVRMINNLGIQDLSQVAVLYRTNAQSRVIEEVFLHLAIPYLLIGGTRFYERKEIKDVVSYLRHLANPKDSISLKRIEKLGKGRLQKFLDFQQSLNDNGVVLASLSPSSSLNEEENSPLAGEKDQMTTIEILDQVIHATGYLDLYDEEDEEDRARLENIKELRSVALAYPNLTEFLENITLVEQEALRQDKKTERKNAVTLMTLHAAKGLEFPVIFMVGMEEGVFPHARSLMDRSELEEERRLCYVGMTRAKEKLFLTYTRRRLFFGQRSSNTTSRFLLEIPEHVIAKSLHVLNAEENDYSSTDPF